MKKSEFIRATFTPWKKGDKARCITSTRDFYGDLVLVAGRTYTVIGVSLPPKAKRHLIELKETGKKHYVDKFVRI